MSTIAGMPWVTIRVAAKRLGISRQAVEKQLARGTLAGRQLEGTWFVSAASIEARRIARKGMVR